MKPDPKTSYPAPSQPPQTPEITDDFMAAAYLGHLRHERELRFRCFEVLTRNNFPIKPDVQWYIGLAQEIFDWVSKGDTGKTPPPTPDK